MNNDDFEKRFDELYDNNAIAFLNSCGFPGKITHVTEIVNVIFTENNISKSEWKNLLVDLIKRKGTLLEEVKEAEWFEYETK